MSTKNKIGWQKYEDLLEKQINSKTNTNKGNSENRTKATRTQQRNQTKLTQKRNDIEAETETATNRTT